VIAGGIGIDASVHWERQLCESDVFDWDIIHNRLLAQALDALCHAPLKPGTIEEARRLSAAFSDSQSIRVSPETFSDLYSDRRTSAYKPAMEFARNILLGLGPIQREGDTPALALLFVMNDLFEAYLGTLISKAARNRGWYERLQSSHPFWERTAIRPDIVLEGDGRRIILDTK